MDGLLLDTEAIYIEAMQAAARTLGREMPLDFCHSMVGVPAPECNLMIEAYYGDGLQHRRVPRALLRARRAACWRPASR